MDRRTRRKEARSAELLEAATRLFVQKGYAGTQVEEVEALANASKGASFVYCASKKALRQVVVSEHIVGPFAKWHAEVQDFMGTIPDLVRNAFKVRLERIACTKAGDIYQRLSSGCCNVPQLASYYLYELIHPGHVWVSHIWDRSLVRCDFCTGVLDAGNHLIMPRPLLHPVAARGAISNPQGTSAEMYFGPQRRHLFVRFGR